MDITAPFHVLIIEDSPEDRADIRQMLLRGSQRHYRFTETETGEAGVSAIYDHLDNPPDCVILDFNLPDMDAFGVLAALRASGARLSPHLTPDDRPLLLLPLRGSSHPLGVLMATAESGSKHELQKHQGNLESIAVILAATVERLQSVEASQRSQVAIATPLPWQPAA